MLNYIIFGKDLEYCVNLMNYLNENNNVLRVIAILNNEKELLKIIIKNNIDMILINLSFSEYNKICKDIQEYLSSTIFILNQKMSKTILQTLNVYDYVENENNYSNIRKKVNTYYSLKETEKDLAMRKVDMHQDIIDKIEKELKYLEIPMEYAGTQYLIEAIYILHCLNIDLEQYNAFNLRKDIYNVIARKHHNPINNIKGDINYVVNKIYRTCEKEKLRNYLRKVSLYKPTPKQIIFAITEKIKIDTIKKLQ